MGLIWHREEKDWDFDSDGFTSELVKRAGGGPVVFSFELLAKGRNIAGPFRASLPDLNSLPVPSGSQGAQDNKRQAPGVNLKFQ